jgi:hypothetical protein
MASSTRALRVLGGVGAVHEDVAIAGGRFGLLHAGGDAIRDVVDLLERVLGGCLVSRNEDRHAVVMVAVPVAAKSPVRFPVITAPVASASSNTIWLLGSRGRYASTPLASLPPPRASP